MTVGKTNDYYKRANVIGHNSQDPQKESLAVIKAGFHILKVPL